MSTPRGTTPLASLAIGTTIDRRAEPVSVDPSELTRHAAFLGAPGSGKTTLALGLVEQLLLQGIPAILVDRKGDLCSMPGPAWACVTGSTVRWPGARTGSVRRSRSPSTRRGDPTADRCPSLPRPLGSGAPDS